MSSTVQNSQDHQVHNRKEFCVEVASSPQESNDSKDAITYESLIDHSLEDTCKLLSGTDSKGELDI